MVKIYSIEGNIGSGKSTFVNILKDALKDNKNVVFMQEPVNEWLEIKDKENENIISKFYRDQNKYAFSFQMMAYISRVSNLKKLVNENKNNPDAVIICERCVFTDKHVFAKMLYDDGKIEEVNYVIYNKWFDEFNKEVDVDGLIYVKADPEVSYKRVLKRNREGEVIPLEYLKNCNDYHNNWIDNEDKKVIILDANNDKGYDLEEYKEWINIVKNNIVYDNLKEKEKETMKELIFNTQYFHDILYSGC